MACGIAVEYLLEMHHLQSPGVPWRTSRFLQGLLGCQDTFKINDHLNSRALPTRRTDWTTRKSLINCDGRRITKRVHFQPIVMEGRLEDLLNPNQWWHFIERFLSLRLVDLVELLQASHN